METSCFLKYYEEVKQSHFLRRREAHLLFAFSVGCGLKEEGVGLLLGRGAVLI